MYVLSSSQMDTTPRKRCRIIALAQHSLMTQRQIAAECRVGLATVNLIIKDTGRLDPSHPRKKETVAGKGRLHLQMIVCQEK